MEEHIVFGYTVDKRYATECYDLYAPNPDPKTIPLIFCYVTLDDDESPNRYEIATDGDNWYWLEDAPDDQQCSRARARFKLTINPIKSTPGYQRIPDKVLRFCTRAVKRHFKVFI